MHFKLFARTIACAKHSSVAHRHIDAAVPAPADIGWTMRAGSGNHHAVGARVGVVKPILPIQAGVATVLEHAELGHVVDVELAVQVKQAEDARQVRGEYREPPVWMPTHNPVDGLVVRT